MNDEPRIIQQWRGYVVNVKPNTFVAHLIPVVGEGGELEAEIKTEKVDASEHKYITLGALFTWSLAISGETKEKITMHSLIEFDKDERFTDDELKAAQKAAKDLMSLFSERQP